MFLRSQHCKLSVALTLGMSLAACTSMIEQAEMADVTDEAFGRQLHAEYLELARAEKAEYDNSDADAFAGRALAAAAGTPTAPENVSARGIADENKGALLAGYRELNEALDNGGRDQQPELAAKTQAAYDCWLQEQEENFQPEDINACRDRFNANLAQLKGALTTAATTTAAAPAPATMRSASYTVYFRFDSDRLSDKAKAIVSKAGKEASAMTVDKIVIDGYADRAGGEDYNVKLSGRRADRVAGWLVDLVPAPLRSKISTRLHGEDNLAVQTSDGTRNAANRRAVIHINP
ncbi:MAG: OmpA family protein [Pseudomonadota bacterium]|nr:OmpA family protein [Pseudomonadota bacterium]